MPPRRRIPRLLNFLAAVAVFVAPAVQAQDAVALHRLDGPITLDGLSDEPAWRQVRPLELTMYAPTFKEPLTERTEILIGYDDAYLYVAGRLYDRDPHGVRANTLYRDKYSGDDVIGVILDTYNVHVYQPDAAVHTMVRVRTDLPGNRGLHRAGLGIAVSFAHAVRPSVSSGAIRVPVATMSTS